jgi:hypothetical protein
MESVRRVPPVALPGADSRWTASHAALSVPHRVVGTAAAPAESRAAPIVVDVVAGGVIRPAAPPTESPAAAVVVGVVVGAVVGASAPTAPIVVHVVVRAIVGPWPLAGAVVVGVVVGAIVGPLALLRERLAAAVVVGVVVGAVVGAVAEHPNFRLMAPAVMCSPVVQAGEAGQDQSSLQGLRDETASKAFSTLAHVGSPLQVNQ